MSDKRISASITSVTLPMTGAKILIGPMGLVETLVVADRFVRFSPGDEQARLRAELAETELGAWPAPSR